MPPKKSAAKKTPGKPDPKKPGKDARRTFEHLGRVQALAPLTSAESADLKLLTQSADSAFRAGLYKASADLLRSAEHLSFAALHGPDGQTVPADLETAIHEEFEHLVERAKEHAEEHPIPKALLALHTRLVRDAAAALQRKAFAAAMEFARAAEALSHVHQLGEAALREPASSKRLRG